METNAQRAARLRPRVLDCLSDMGHGNRDSGRHRFLEHAIWCARQRDMRLWKTGGVRSATEQSAMLRTAGQSLGRLLGEIQSHVSVDGRVVPAQRTAVNATWVLDIWEVACDDWFRVKPAKPEEVEQMDELEAASPSAVATMVGPPARPLSARILDAYMNRDSDAMLNALHELEQKGL